MQVLLVGINSKYIHTALGVRYVGEYARQQGHEVRLLEESINSSLLGVLEKIMAEDFAVCGLDVHIWNRDFVFRLTRLLRRLRPDAVIVIGGPEVSFEAERALQELPEADYLVQGEGELVFASLLAFLEEPQAELPPRHVAYRDVQGRVCLNGGPAVVEDLGLLPFPYPDLRQIVQERRIVYYEATRGCPFHCSYCLSGTSHSVRLRPLSLVLEDLDRFIAAGVRLVKFVDRTYNLREDYYLPMLRHIAGARTQATFHLEIKADLLSERVLEFLATVPKGRLQLEIGIQSTNPPTLAAIDRRDRPRELARNVRRLLAYGNMHIHVDLIAGLPYEGLAEFAKSFNDVYALGAQMLQLGFLKVLPGTRMRREAELHGLRYMDGPPYEVLATKYMPYGDLQLLRRLENVFEQVHNGGYFPHLMAFLSGYGADGAFAFYCRFTSWWLGHGLYPQSHSPRALAEILYRFIVEYFIDDQGLDFMVRGARELALELLRFDVFTRQPGWEPDFLVWQAGGIFEEIKAFWRDEERVRRYVPDYRPSSWRTIRKNYPIERFVRHPDTWEEGEYWFLHDVKQGRLWRLPL